MDYKTSKSYHKYIATKKAYLEKKGGITQESGLCGLLCVKQGSLKGSKKIGEKCRCGCQCESMKCDKSFSLMPGSDYREGECKEIKRSGCIIL